jgi:two-component system, OmpR family, response regulator TctD
LRRFPAAAGPNAVPADGSVVAGALATAGGSGALAAPGESAFWVDRDSGAVYHHRQAMELPPRELALLRALLARPGQAMTKERLFDLVFPGELDVQPEAIEVVAYRLRKRLAGTEAQLITLRGLGYLLKIQGTVA